MLDGEIPCLPHLAMRLTNIVSRCAYVTAQPLRLLHFGWCFWAKPLVCCLNSYGLLINFLSLLMETVLELVRARLCVCDCVKSVVLSLSFFALLKLIIRCINKRARATLAEWYTSVERTRGPTEVRRHKHMASSTCRRITFYI